MIARAALLVALALAGATPLAAQAGLSLDSQEFRGAVARPYLEYLGRAPCAVPRWRPVTTSASALAASVQPVRGELQRRLGPLPGRPAGRVRDAQRLFEDERFAIDLVEVDGRLPGVPVLAYVGRPKERTPGAPIAVVLHGGGTLPSQVFGWDLRGTTAIRVTTSPLSGVGLALLAAGFTVVAPWISDEIGFWPQFPWLDWDRAGYLLHRQTGRGNAASLILPQLGAVLDYALAEAGGPASVGVLGWGEGSLLAGLLAASDPRVSAVVRFDPPIDRRRYRATPAGVAMSSPFTQLDCALGDVELAALVAPRPLLHAWSIRDRHYAGMAPFRSDSVRLALERIAALAGGSTPLAPDQTGEAAGRRAVGWLATALGRPADSAAAPLPAPAEPPQHQYPAAQLRFIRDGLGIFLSNQRPCRPLPFAPSFASTAAFRDGQARLRRAVLEAARIRLPRRDARPGIVVRDTVADLPTYTLEWIYAKSAFRGVDVAGLLATPKASEVAYPAVLSFDGNYFVSEPFGLPPAGQTNYLGAYARQLAAQGTVVFAPAVPYWFPGVADPFLMARDPSAPSAWGYLLSVYRGSLDLLLGEPGVDPDRVIAYGLSYAGWAATLTTAFDPRVRELVYSNPVQGIGNVFASVGASELPAFFMTLCSVGDAVQQYLVAPRRFIWENGVQDPGNGFERSPLATVRDVEAVYRRLGAEERFSFIRHDGGHQTRPDAVLPALLGREF